jgi:hypothetical protein
LLFQIEDIDPIRTAHAAFSSRSRTTRSASGLAVSSSFPKSRSQERRPPTSFAGHRPAVMSRPNSSRELVSSPIGQSTLWNSMRQASPPCIMNSQAKMTPLGIWKPAVAWT